MDFEILCIFMTAVVEFGANLGCVIGASHLYRRAWGQMARSISVRGGEGGPRYC